MKQLSLLTFFCLLIFGSLSAQNQETLFSRNGVSGIWGAAIFNYSSFDEDWSLVRGGNIGFEFGNSVFVGYSWNSFRDDADIEGSLNDFRMKYRGLLLGISPRAEKAVHPRISFLTGGGKVFPESGDRDRVFVFQPSAGLELNVFRWFRVGLEGGYRFVTNSNNDRISNGDLSAPFVQLDLRFGISWGD